MKGVRKMLHDEECSLLIGGKAGDGINAAGLVLSRLLATMGYWPYMYYDYPSLIRGGHNFAIVRGSLDRTVANRDQVDFLIALDKKTLELHQWRTADAGVIIYNADIVEAEGIGIPVGAILKTEGAGRVMGNTCLIGAFSRAAGIPWEVAEAVIRKEIRRETEMNLRVARRGYDAAHEITSLVKYDAEPLALFTGNEAIGLGLLSAGLDAYISYPMTPSSGILHFLAAEAERFSLLVNHPENEIAAMLMAQGLAAGGARTAVGTSGGGFCLMTEGLSMAGMTETPVTVVLSQRGGPSTGTPTYGAQADLLFARHAGQGEFPRFIVAPGDAEQAVVWSARALSLSWEFQVPSFVLVDKNLSEGLYGLNPEIRMVPDATRYWDGNGVYERYAEIKDGISPFAPIGTPGAVVKINSYSHDPSGLTTEDSQTVAALTEKQMRKAGPMKEAVERLNPVVTGGDAGAVTAVVAWGSAAGVCGEVAETLSVRMVQPVVLEPFPTESFGRAMEGAERLITVEYNYTGQLGSLLALSGFPGDASVRRYDNRPFTVEDLTRRLQEVVL